MNSSAREMLPPGHLTLRPFEAWTASPVGPALIFAALFTAASAGGFILASAHSALPDSARYSIWFDALNAVILAYLPAALVLLRRGIARDLVELRPSLRCTDSQFDGFLSAATRVPNRRVAIFCGIGVVAFAFMPLYDPGFFSGTRPSIGDPVLTFFMLRHTVTGWFVGYALASEVGGAAAYRRIGRDHVAVDLLDTRPLHAFARMGIRSALAWILAVSLVSLFWLGPGAAGDSNGIIIVAVIVLAGVSLVYSVSGVRETIRREKETQLDALRAKIRERRDTAVEATPENTEVWLPLASLIAYHDLVERTPEWPFDAPMMARLALYTTLGLGSWLGGALVERLLEKWF